MTPITADTLTLVQVDRIESAARRLGDTFLADACAIARRRDDDDLATHASALGQLTVPQARAYVAAVVSSLPSAWWNS